MFLVLKLTLVDRLHPVWHRLVPHLQSDDVIGDQTEEPNQTFLDVIRSRCQDLPVTSNLGVVGRVWKDTLNENVFVEEKKSQETKR